MQKPGLSLIASPILNVHQVDKLDGQMEVAFTLVNRDLDTWKGRVEFPEQQGWRFEPNVLDFKLDGRSKSEQSVRAVPPQSTGEGEFSLNANLTLPGGSEFTVPVRLKRRPSLIMADLPSKGISDWSLVQMPDGPVYINRPEQVVIGRPPKLTSIQEDQYWQGPSELSARV